jgi:two-component system, OmpR family, sensor kinase
MSKQHDDTVQDADRRPDARGRAPRQGSELGASDKPRAPVLSSGRKSPMTGDSLRRIVSGIFEWVRPTPAAMRQITTPRRPRIIGLSIRTRIYIFQAVVVASIVMTATVIYFMIQQTQHDLQRVEWATRQLDAITELTVHANRYSEQIAEFLLIGEPERADFENASAALEAGFDRLEKVTRDEFAFLRDSGAQEEELDEIYRLHRMRTLYAELNRAVAEVFALRDQGRLNEAITLFRSDIENRLDAEFEALLRAARLDEEEEVARTKREADALRQRLGWITAIINSCVIVLCVVSGLLLVRSLMRPIKLLTAGTEAISRGELHHRIAYDSQDELGALVRHFNEMAIRGQEHRTQLLDAQSNLERKVATRTAELDAANKRLSDLDRARVQFLADISHELRTPLTALRGEAEIVLRHGAKPEAVYRDTLGRIVTQTFEMGRLIDDLLFLSRSETDTIRFVRQRVLLQQVVADAAREGEALGRGRGIAVQTEYPPDPLWVEADPQRLKQALMILLDNAIKYSPLARAVVICVTAEDGHGQVAVRDQGMGIPAEDLPRIFERFYRGRPSTTTAGGVGSGLGLAIAKWLIEKQGGEISIASELGSFTEVVIRIPRLRAITRGENSAGGR